MRNLPAACNRRSNLLLLPALGACALLTLPSAAGQAGKPADALPRLSQMSAEAVAQQVDRLIDTSLIEQDVVPTVRSSDEDFLRRVTLDLSGRIPAPKDVTLFGLTPGDEKRADAIGRLLESDDFAQTWARYWRDVIYSRATETRAQRSQGVFTDWMAEQLNANRPWDEIVTELITATGDTSEDGSTGLIFAHGGDATELAAETSRIFLGIQIQCANCHDHPYDAWKRKDFHELAAFFPRIRVRSDRDGNKRTFHVESVDIVRDNQPPPIDVAQLFRFLDRNRDGKLTKGEAGRNKQFGNRFTKLIKVGDKDADGALSREELKTAQLRSRYRPGGRSGEYFTPDLENPGDPGTLTEPVFFIGEVSVPFGTPDVDRRTALAQSIVSPQNPWFARALVNRIWAEMLGEGFSTPIDDMGPERSAQPADVLDTLSAGFAANGYDLKWLYRTIALTETYQCSLPPEDSEGAPAAFAAMSPTRLRGDQLYNAVTQVLEVDELSPRSMPRSANMMGYGGNEAAREAFSQLFNFDPSTPQTDLTGSVLQALFMMNSQVTNSAANGRGDTVLARTLRDFQDDDAALSELYLRVLSREPTVAETEICRQHITGVGERTAAFEDIQWSLMNSSEFLTKR